MDVLRGGVGILVLVGVAFACSVNRKRVNWWLVGKGLLLQLVIGVLILKVPTFYRFFESLSAGFVQLIGYTEAGSGFVFGSGLITEQKLGFIVAFKVLPIIIFFSALSSGLYYLGVLQLVVRALAWVMIRTIGVSGYEALSAAGNIFLGQTEAPLLIKPFMPRLTRSQLFCIMTGGMATIAGSVMGAYIYMLGGESKSQQVFFATHLLTASLLNAPAALIISKIMIPDDTAEGQAYHSLTLDAERPGENLLHALAIGAADGLKLAALVGGMLIAFLALVAAINDFLSAVPGTLLGLNPLIAESTGGKFTTLSLDYIFGQLFRPLAWAAGVDWADTLAVGGLLGKKVALNEFVAYETLASYPPGFISEKSRLIVTYALCGFANLGSIAIQIGGLGALAPQRTGEVSALGLRAVLAGSLATLLSGTIAGLLY